MAILHHVNFVDTKERGLKLMLSLIKEINSAVNNFIWGVPAKIGRASCRERV